jgi:hypothetical protein
MVSLLAPAASRSVAAAAAAAAARPREAARRARRAGEAQLGCVRWGELAAEEGAARAGWRRARRPGQALSVGGDFVRLVRLTNRFLVPKLRSSFVVAATTAAAAAAATTTPVCVACLRTGTVLLHPVPCWQVTCSRSSMRWRPCARLCP